jgi:hypothetical protein
VIAAGSIRIRILQTLNLADSKGSVIGGGIMAERGAQAPAKACANSS